MEKRKGRRGGHSNDLGLEEKKMEREICSTVFKSPALGIGASDLGETGGDGGNSEGLLDLGVAPSSSSPPIAMGLQGSSTFSSPVVAPMTSLEP